MKEISTGKVLRGEDAPLASELDAWMEKNPGYEEVPRDEDSDDDTDDEEKSKAADTKTTEDLIAKAKAEAAGDDEATKGEDYYAIAHTISEEITEQAGILVGGRLKEYQVKG